MTSEVQFILLIRATCSGKKGPKDPKHTVASSVFLCTVPVSLYNTQPYSLEWTGVAVDCTEYEYNLHCGGKLLKRLVPLHFLDWLWF